MLSSPASTFTLFPDRNCKYSIFLTSNYRIQLKRFTLNFLQKVQTQFFAVFLFHQTTILEPFLHRASVLPLSFVEHFLRPNDLSQLQLEHSVACFSNRITHLSFVDIGNWRVGTWAVVIFRVFSAFRKSFVPLKKKSLHKTSTHHRKFCQKLKTFRRWFLQLKKKHVNWLFSIALRRFSTERTNMSLIWTRTRWCWLKLWS